MAGAGGDVLAAGMGADVTRMQREGSEGGVEGHPLSVTAGSGELATFRPSGAEAVTGGPRYECGAGIKPGPSLLSLCTCAPTAVNAGEPSPAGESRPVLRLLA